MARSPGARGVGMHGLGEQRADRILLDDLPQVHHPYPVANARDHAQIVADVQDRRVELVSQLVDQVQHGRLDGHVQGGGRLVHDEERRVVEQRHGDDDTLLLPAGQLVRVTLHDAIRIGHVDRGPAWPRIACGPHPW